MKDDDEKEASTIEIFHLLPIWKKLFLDLNSTLDQKNQPER